MNAAAVRCAAPTKLPAQPRVAPVQSGPLRVSTVLKIAVEVCRGMDYLHKRKIVHRDLKVQGGLAAGRGSCGAPLRVILISMRLHVANPWPRMLPLLIRCCRPCCLSPAAGRKSAA